jgi:hypothetical protein
MRDIFSHIPKYSVHTELLSIDQGKLTTGRTTEAARRLGKGRTYESENQSDLDAVSCAGGICGDWHISRWLRRSSGVHT